MINTKYEARNPKQMRMFKISNDRNIENNEMTTGIMWPLPCFKHLNFAF